MNTSYKILKAFKTYSICGVVFMLFFTKLNAQDTLLNKFGLWVINDTATYQSTLISNSGKKMMDIKKCIPSIKLQLMYAGTKNFMHTKLYPAIKTSYLRKDAIIALQKVQAELKKKNLSLKIWDAYRPYSVTEKMWEQVKDSRYAADPAFGSGHNRGIAVDLTLIDLHSGKELNMGTGFDNFTDTAHADFKELPAKILANRILLKATMEQFGFKVLETEWWHFYLPDTKKYELLNLDFETLQKLN
ncbi:MAG: M15 family metallopeptidase [Bacteroidetes bacterium]|nr:M15 family metallopeptidase [Bacteroidota bacterium]